MEQPLRHHFPNLDGLRCVGVFIVLGAHLELLKSYLGFASNFRLFQYPDLGNVAVTWFMVVSGFLITFLLLKERSAPGGVSILRFYKRRITRIWPVYYLVVVVTFFILIRIPFFSIEGHTPGPEEPVLSLLGLYALHLSNFHFLFPPLVYVAHLWTVGVEEQFYLAWPWLVKYSRNILRAIIAVVVIQMILKVTVYIIPAEGEYGSYVHAARRFFFLSRFEAIALGAIAAKLFVDGSGSIMKFLYTKKAQWLCIACILILLSLGRLPKAYGHFAHALFFAVLVLNLAREESSVIKLSWRPMQYIGKISYGMYVYHPIIMVIVLKLFLLFTSGNEPTVAANVLLYVGVYSATIAVAAISYRFMERPMMNWGRSG